MRLKMDENIGTRGQELLRREGHDVATVISQRMCGATDDELIAACRTESRALVTLDKDFANIVRYPPEDFAGIVVLRLSGPVTLQAIEHALLRFSRAAAVESVVGKLWIVETAQIRVLDPSEA